MSDTIDRMTAIERMAKGEKCETFVFDGWYATLWAHFDAHTQFRIPPEPRREALEAWAVVHDDGSVSTYGSKENAERYKEPGEYVAMFREVLPDEVTLQILGRDDARLALHKAIHAIEFGNKTDDKLIIAQLADQGVYLAKEVKS